MTYDELLETLTSLRASAILGVVATTHAIRDRDAVIVQIRGQLIGFRVDEGPGRGYTWRLDPLADMLADDAAREVLRSNVNLFMKQSLVRHAYEHVMYYCEEKKCLPLMRAQPWYMFARIIRNTLSHKTGSYLHRWPDNAPSSVTFRGHTISKTDVGTEIQFDIDEAFYLFDELVGLARTLPFS